MNGAKSQGWPPTAGEEAGDITLARPRGIAGQGIPPLTGRISPAQEERETRLHTFQRQIAREKGAAADMIEALRRAGKVVTVTAEETVDRRHLEEGRSAREIVDYIHLSLARTIGEGLEKIMKIERRPGHDHAVMIRAAVTVLK